ncbi:hypothetical protein F4778DRAFT_778690 [Xylariomycetidae sp. FL2044]|nr:hypothetical protein F4778DRAFT_778690 [Xylariomycetidae sp. FL2044]
MVPPQFLASLAAGLALIGSPALVSASPGRTHARDISPAGSTSISPLQGRADDSQGTPFWGFDGCSDPKKQSIVRAWWDVVDLARIPSSVDFSKPGTLEQRFFGADLGDRGDAQAQIKRVFDNIMDLYTSKITGKIRIGCQDIHQDHRADDKQTKCSNTVPGQGTKKIGGYAFAYGPNHEDGTVVLCAPFFAPGQESLPEVLAELRSHQGEQKNSRLMTGKFAMLLHELAHLPSIEGQIDNTVAIIDQKFNPKALIPQAAYGLYWVERLADSTRQRARAYLNADNYAWYASTKYFEAFFGTPDAYDKPREDPDESLPKAGRGLIISLFTNVAAHFGGADITNEWHFFTTDVGHGVGCNYASDAALEEIKSGGPSEIGVPSDADPENPPWPGGDFKLDIDGQECHYKCNGGNAGRLFCPDREISCTGDRERSEDPQHCNVNLLIQSNVWCEF